MERIEQSTKMITLVDAEPTKTVRQVCGGTVVSHTRARTDNERCFSYTTRNFSDEPVPGYRLAERMYAPPDVDQLPRSPIRHPNNLIGLNHQARDVRGARRNSSDGGRTHSKWVRLRAHRLRDATGARPRHMSVTRILAVLHRSP